MWAGINRIKHLITLVKELKQALISQSVLIGLITATCTHIQVFS